jgi:protein-S-isoprenylcysteine O-methyltransferase Ste14
MAVRLEHRVPPPIVGAMTAALMLGVAWVVPALTFNLAWRLPIAVVIAVAGLAIGVVAVGHFLRARTTVDPLDPGKASALVASGLYRFTRNPMYLGVALLLLAWAVYLGNIASLAGLPLFIAYMNRFQIEPEERALQARFGQDFEAYCRRVRRWI